MKAQILVTLDGTATVLTHAMLTVPLSQGVMPASFMPSYQTGDELWSYRVPNTTDFGVVLLRGGKVVIMTEASATPMETATGVMPAPAPTPPVMPAATTK